MAGKWTKRAGALAIGAVTLTGAMAIADDGETTNNRIDNIEGVSVNGIESTGNVSRTVIREGVALFDEGADGLGQVTGRVATGAANGLARETGNAPLAPENGLGENTDNED
ncbi:MAG: hypothetical protein S0880_07375 [Actinomycetota bacterium]|nr:hypothetical protein [Actinomycetota bacterium]